MAEIRVGQVWRERGGQQRIGKIEQGALGVLDENHKIIRIRLTVTAPNKPGIRPWTDISDERLNRDWELIEPRQPRKIALELAKDTTATECGQCWMRGYMAGDQFYCRPFQKYMDVIEERGVPVFRVTQRLPECVQAEAR